MVERELGADKELKEALNLLEQEEKKSNGHIPVSDEQTSQIRMPENFTERELVDLYMDQATQAPLLTAEEEVEIGKTMEKGKKAEEELCRGNVNGNYKALTQQVDQAKKARDKIFLSNTRLVISVARRYHSEHLTFLDLVQEGNVGLLKAVDKWDYKRGHKFSTYAVWWIRQSISKSISEQSRSIRIPRRVYMDTAKVFRTIESMVQDLDREPTNDELSEKLEMPVKKIGRLKKLASRIYSLDTPLPNNQERTLGDIVFEQNSFVQERVAISMLKENLPLLLEKLNPREQQIISRHYGLYDGKPMTQAEVGRKLGLTRQRIQQIEREAFSKLKILEEIQQLLPYIKE